MGRRRTGTSRRRAVGPFDCGTGIPPAFGAEKAGRPHHDQSNRPATRRGRGVEIRAGCDTMAAMTYCLGIMTKFGLVLASDSRTNAGYDQVNTCRKMYTFERPGERVFVVLAS